MNLSLYSSLKEAKPSDTETENDREYSLDPLYDISRLDDVSTFPKHQVAGESFDPAKLTPIFHGYFYYKNAVYFETLEDLEGEPGYISDLKRIRCSSKAVYNCEAEGDFDPCKTHPACCGYHLLTESLPNTKSFFESLRSPKTCSAREYVETYIFPILLPAMEKMLKEAKKEQAFIKRRTKFNGCDFLTEYLYRHNPAYSGRQDVLLWEIPFVERILKENPRPPIPLSLLLTEEEAAGMIQSVWRGYQVRKDPEVQELRKYQREMREEEYDINFRVSEFWKKHPVEDVDDEPKVDGYHDLQAEQDEETSLQNDLCL